MKYNFAPVNQLTEEELKEEVLRMEYLLWLFMNAEPMSAYDYRFRRTMFDQATFHKMRCERRLDKLTNPICPLCGTPHIIIGET